MTIKNVRVLPAYSSKDPYYTELEIVKKKDDQLLIRTWDGKYKVLKLVENKDYYYPVNELHEYPEGW